MSNSPETIVETITKWAATRTDEVVLDPRNGYYSFEIVVDAYNKGVENGATKADNNLKEMMRNIFYENSKHAIEVTKTVIKYFSDNKFNGRKIFINITMGSVVLILSVDDKIYLDAAFLEKAYSFSSKIQEEYHTKGINLQINFIQDSEKINLNLLREDGFDIAFDLETAAQLY